MKNIGVIICFMFFLLFAVGTSGKFSSINVEEVESICPISNDKEWVDMSSLYHQLVAVEITGDYAQTHVVNMARAKRVVSLQLTNFLKNLHRNLSGLDSAFTQNNIRVYRSNSSNSESSGKYYYVFTLRHIII